MTVFFRLLQVEEKEPLLRRSVREMATPWTVCVEPKAFSVIPGSPFAYWASESIRGLFAQNRRVEGLGRTVLGGLKTLADDRFVRVWWEVGVVDGTAWANLAKGGGHSPVYSDPFLCVNWKTRGDEISWYGYQRRPREGFGAGSRGVEAYFRPGLTWPRRTQSGLGLRAMPSGCIFADKGPAVFVEGDQPNDLLAFLAMATSCSFRYLVDLQMAFGSYEVGVIQRTPVPTYDIAERDRLAGVSRQAWSRKRTLDTINEVSHAFLLPRALRGRLGPFDPAALKAEISGIQHEIDDLAFSLYGIQGEDRRQIETWSTSARSDLPSDPEEDEASDDRVHTLDEAFDVISWAVGVAFGRFDIRLATGERAAPPEPEPFDPLPDRSPGMWPKDEPRTTIPPDVLVDDPGHGSDIAVHVADVLAQVGWPTPDDLRQWLSRDFFPFHIQRYSKSRRKAPIYWQLATLSASYSVWLYLHAFSADTMYKVQNDHVGPKLRHEEQKLDGLRRDYGDSPTASQRKDLDRQEAFVAELRELLDEVKRVAPLWKPDLDDGVIINFALLWRLVPHHRPWQKECKATWDALCGGEYDWAHLAMHLWPERVVPKCRQDRSLAIAHGLEDVFWFEGPDGKWRPLPNPTRPLADLIKERTSPAVKAALTSSVSMSSPEAARGRKVGRRSPVGPGARH